MGIQPRLIQSPERERWLRNHIPYRVHILRGLDIYNARGAINGPLRPAQPSLFEAALVTCRWIASFMGVSLDKSGNLRQTLSRPKKDDVFSIDLGARLLDPSLLPPAEEALLAAVLKGANVASAHAVLEGAHNMNDAQVAPAAALLVTQVKLCVYDYLGMPMPHWEP